MPGTLEEQVEIGEGTELLRGTLHRPAGTPRCAVLFCYPLFEERKSSCRPLVEAARHLAGAGCAVLRFDYRGCGDGPGDFEQYAPSDWLADVDAAAGFLIRHAPAIPFGLLGLRFGANLALQSARRLPAAFAVAWEPIPEGRAWIEEELRRKMVREMMTFGRSRASRGALREQLERGCLVDLDGYPVSPRLFRELCGDVPGETGSAHPPVLVVHVGPRDPPAARLAALRDRFSSAEFRTWRALPFWNRIGLTDCSALIRTTGDWIERALT